MRISKHGWPFTLAFLVGCAGATSQGHEPSTARPVGDAPSTPRPEVEVRASEQPATHQEELRPCERVEQHNLAVLRDASLQAGKVLEKSFPGRLPALISELQGQVDTQGKETVPWPAGQATPLASLDDEQLRTLELVSGGSFGSVDVRSYARDREKLALLTGLRRAVQEGEAIAESAEEASLELCAEDARGAWAYWLVSANTAPSSSALDDWHTAREVRLARVQNDGTLVVAPELPSYLNAPTVEEHFSTSPGSNCCELDYGQGSPRVLFNNDQDGDGIPELGLLASFAVEGSHQESTIIYRFRDQGIETQRFGEATAEDVDGDGLIDLLVTQWASAADECGSGFESSSGSPLLLGHALPDGSFSFDDAKARAYLQKACPAPPQHVRTPEDVWCALSWGRSKEAVLRDARQRCRMDPCEGDQAVTACETMELAVKGFDPPLRLDGASSSPQVERR